MNMGLLKSDGKMFQDRKDKLLADFAAMAGKAQDLVKETGSTVGNRFAGVRLNELGSVAAERAKYAASCTGRLAKDNPWATVAIVAAAAALIGVILSRR